MRNPTVHNVLFNKPFVLPTIPVSLLVNPYFPTTDYLVGFFKSVFGEFMLSVIAKA